MGWDQFVFVCLIHVIRLLEEIRLTSWYGKYPIPGGCLGFMNHEQYYGPLQTHGYTREN